MAPAFSKLERGELLRTLRAHLLTRSAVAGALVALTGWLFASQLGLFFLNWREPAADVYAVESLASAVVPVGEGALSGAEINGFGDALSEEVFAGLKAIDTSTFSSEILQCLARLREITPTLTPEQINSCATAHEPMNELSKTRVMLQIMAVGVLGSVALGASPFVWRWFANRGYKLFGPARMNDDAGTSEPDVNSAPESDTTTTVVANEEPVAEEKPASPEAPADSVQEPSEVPVKVAPETPLRAPYSLAAAPNMSPPMRPTARIVSSPPTVLIDEEHVRAIALASSAATAELSNALLRQLQTGLQGNNREIELLKEKILEVAQTAKSDSRNLQGRLNRGGDVRRELEKLREAIGRLWQWVYQLSQDLQLASFNPPQYPDDGFYHNEQEAGKAPGPMRGPPSMSEANRCILTVDGVQFNLGTPAGRDQWNAYLASRNVAMNAGGQEAMAPPNPYMMDQQHMNHYNQYMFQQQEQQAYSCNHEQRVRPQMVPRSEEGGSQQRGRTGHPADDAKYYAIELSNGSEGSNEDGLPTDDEHSSAARPKLSVDTRAAAKQEGAASEKSALSPEIVMAQAEHPVIVAAADRSKRDLLSATSEAKCLWDKSDLAAMRMRAFRSASGGDLPYDSERPLSGGGVSDSQTSIMTATTVRDTQSVPSSPFAADDLAMPRYVTQQRRNSPTASRSPRPPSPTSQMRQLQQQQQQQQRGQSSRSQQNAHKKSPTGERGSNSNSNASNGTKKPYLTAAKSPLNNVGEGNKRQLGYNGKNNNNASNSGGIPTRSKTAWEKQGTGNDVSAKN
ncbi:hypothetical protein BZA70DRAFT_290400 [Myxozyma melibiosi]|uniref:Peroxin-14 n=1 Tax=Myxozyma melibiosi TaxID=54550 RepID=A0ABR1F3K9_9ASCO